MGILKMKELIELLKSNDNINGILITRKGYSVIKEKIKDYLKGKKWVKFPDGEEEVDPAVFGLGYKNLKYIMVKSYSPFKNKKGFILLNFLNPPKNKEELKWLKQDSYHHDIILVNSNQFIENEDFGPGISCEPFNTSFKSDLIRILEGKISGKF